MKASIEPTPPNLSSEPRKNRRQSWTSHTSKKEGNQIIKSHRLTHSIFTSIPMLYPAPAVAHTPQFLHRQRVRRRYFFTLHRGCKLDSKCALQDGPPLFFSNCGPAKTRFLTTQRASKAQYDFGCEFILLATAWQH